MSYAKAMKWGRRNPKGIKQMYMGFNSSGITSEEIKTREQLFVAEMEAAGIEARNEYRKNVNKIIALRTGSWDWAWCAFDRRFGLRNFETLNQ